MHLMQFSLKFIIYYLENSDLSQESHRKGFDLAHAVQAWTTVASCGWQWDNDFKAVIVRCIEKLFLELFMVSEPYALTRPARLQEVGL